MSSSNPFITPSSHFSSPSFTALLILLHRFLYSFCLLASSLCSCHLRNALHFASIISMVLSDIHLLCFLRLLSRCFCADSRTVFFSSDHLFCTLPCPFLAAKLFSTVSAYSSFLHSCSKNSISKCCLGIVVYTFIPTGVHCSCHHPCGHSCPGRMTSSAL